MNKKLNIAFFLDNFFPQINGVVTSSLNTALELSRRGHSIYIIAPNAKSKDIDEFKDKYYEFPTQYENGFSAYFYPDFKFTFPFSNKPLKILKKFKPNIIHFHAPFTLGYQAIRAARKFGIPVVGTFHTFFAEPEYLSLIGMENSKFLINFGWWYSNQYFNRCDAVVSPGKDTAKFLMKKDIKNKVHIISNGVDVQKYSNFSFNEKLLPIDIKKEEDWILFIGRLSKEKSLDVLLDAVSKVISKRKNTRLLIVGNGPYKNEMEQTAIKKGIRDKIHFTGMIPNSCLLSSGIIKKMKLFATASTSENQPMTILESIMFGLPIVGVDARGIPELIDKNGFVVKPNKANEMANKIIEILENKELHNKFSKRSIELRKMYDIQTTTNYIEKLYLDLISSKK